ncbi:hypothetical protein JZ751_014470, partial [Albula glossodonta]
MRERVRGNSPGQKRVNGPTTLIERGEGGESQPGSGAEPQTSRSGEGDQKRGGFTMPHSLLGYQSRSPVFRTLPRTSSGYFSFDSDSLPSSPLMTHNKATQTPNMPQVPPRPFRPRSLSMPADMRPELWVAQELRRIGDELNGLYLHR